MSAQEEIKKRRIEKLENFRKAGIDPYPSEVKAHKKIREAILNFESFVGKKIVLVGRIRTIRVHGGATFLHFEDFTGRFQAYLRRDRLGEQRYEFFLDNFDIGDFALFEGTLFKTKRGEKTIEVENYQILSKSILPLPEKWHGLKDIEERFRKRYLDILMSPEVKEKFILRSKLIQAVREFFLNKGYIEVETPILQPLYGGALADPFKTYHKSLDMELYLRISSELYLKRLIVAGFEKVFEICRIFRNEGVDAVHNPEFTMLETMWAYANYKDNMDLMEELYESVAKRIFNTTKIEYQGKEIDLKRPWKRITMEDIIKEKLKIDFSKIDVSEAKEQAKKFGIDTKGLKTKGEIMSELFDQKIIPLLWQPTIVYNYPIEVCPLAKRCKDNPFYAERFQHFIAGIECSNNYSELNDPQEIEKNLKWQQERRKRLKGETHPLDKDFIKAIEYGMPPTSGIGIGLDRMAIIFTNSKTLREVIFFPLMRPR
ncbi:lysine--tRNA ligase [bacterium]|nr:lysine--tRNA ligase [bacterium]